MSVVELNAKISEIQKTSTMIKYTKILRKNNVYKYEGKNSLIATKKKYSYGNYTKWHEHAGFWKLTITKL